MKRLISTFKKLQPPFVPYITRVIYTSGWRSTKDNMRELVPFFWFPYRWADTNFYQLIMMICSHCQPRYLATRMLLFNGEFDYQRIISVIPLGMNVHRINEEYKGKKNDWKKLKQSLYANAINNFHVCSHVTRQKGR